VKIKRASLLFASSLFLASVSVSALLLGTIQTEATEIIDGGTTVTVPADHASPWVINDNLSVGDTGNGTLVINAGSSVSVTTFNQAYIGNGAGSIGTVNVVGGSFLPPVTLGVSGTGTINASAGALIDSSSVIGLNVGSLGTLNLSGGSTWTNEPNLEVGASGTGVVNISGGSTATSQYGGIGDTVTGVGTVTVTGNGSQWTNSATVYIGKSGQGTLAIANGGQVSIGEIFTGYYSSGVGTITVDGTGSQLTTGVITAGNGYGSADPACALPGNGCTSSVTVTNHGVISDSGSLSIGNNSAGALTIASGGVVTAGDVYLAQGVDSSATITGIGSQLNANSLYIGGGGAGTTTISAGGAAVIGGGGVQTGYSGNNSLTVTGAGSHLTSTGDINLNSGTLTISNGGVVSGANAYVSYEADATVNVTGAGSQWNNSGDIQVGYFAYGFVAALNITNGATVTSANGILAPYGDSGTNAVVTVSGAGSSWIMSVNLTVGVADSGTLPNDTGGTLTIANGGAITDVNGIVASGSVATGVVTVTGANSVWTNSGTVTVGDAGQGTLTVSNGGTVIAPTMTIANQVGSFGTVNVGAGALSPAAPSGVLNIGTIAFGAGTGTLVLNHTDSNYNLTPDITGNGTILVLGGTTHYAANGSGFSGTTMIANAILSVNGTLGGTTTVSTGGTLKGNGTIGSVIVANGGSIAPGNSIGTLHATGNVTFAPGSTYTAELNSAGQSDLITTTGTARINGGTVVVPAGNVFNNSKIYTILTATGGVSGEFSSLNTPFARVFLVYDAYDVYLKYIPGGLGVTRNQIAAGSGLQSVGQGPVYQAVLALSDPDSTNRALDQVSGEVHASAKTALIEDSHFVRDAANDRLRAASNGTDTTGDLGYAQDDQPLNLRPSIVDGPTAWARGFGGWSNVKSDGNAASLQHFTSGFVAGLDGPVGETGRFGFLTGYSHTNFNTDGRGSGSSANYHVGLYGSVYDGPIGLRSSLIYTRHEIDTAREVGFAGFSDRLNAENSASTVQAATELGYQIEALRGTIEPFANVAYVNLYTGGFSETSGPAALSANGQFTNTAFSTFGVRDSTKISTGGLEATARGMIGWRTAYGDITPVSENRFAGGDAFNVAAPPIARQAAVFEAGLDVKIDQFTTIGAFYYGQYALNAISNGFNVRLSGIF
jgi:outer membrane autotransporter protein